MADGSRASADVKALALGHVRELERRRRELDEMIERPDCPILATLGAEEEPARWSKPKSRSRRGFAVA